MRGASAWLGACALVVACSARPGGALDGRPCQSDSQCKSHVCKEGTCTGTSCSCGPDVCSELGTISADCTRDWLCVHHHGDPLYGEPAGNTCMPTCAGCPAHYRCSVPGQRICDYEPGSSAGDAGASDAHVFDVASRLD